jgi:hypothetical protein
VSVGHAPEEWKAWIESEGRAGVEPEPGGRLSS